jgi:hypothetical protein
MKLAQKLTLPIGLILLATYALMDNFLPETRTMDFLKGFLLGLSIVLNIYYIIVLIKWAKED